MTPAVFICGFSAGALVGLGIGSFLGQRIGEYRERLRMHRRVWRPWLARFEDMQGTAAISQSLDDYDHAWSGFVADD